MYAKQARIKALRSVKSSESACVSGTASAGARKRRRDEERAAGKSLHIFISQHPSKFTHEYGVFMLSTRGIVTYISLSLSLSLSFSVSLSSNLPRKSSEISSLLFAWESREKWKTMLVKFIGSQHLSNPASKPSSEMGERVSGHVRPIKNASMASLAHSRSNRLCFLLSLLVVFLVSGLR